MNVGTSDRLWWPWIGLPLAGIVLIVSAEPLTAVLRRLLPFGAEVRSAGTQYPSFTDAYPTTLRGLGILVIVATIVAPLAARLEVSRRGQTIALIAVALATGIVYGWLAWPHNGFPSNARIHWVDIFYNRADDFFYALVKLPHVIFYGHPWLLQALNGTLNVALAGYVVLRLTDRRWAAIGASISFAVSSQLLRFANSAEDLQLAVTSLLVVALAYVVRRPVFLAGAIFLAMLSRPPFLLVLPALALTEFVLIEPSRENSWWRSHVRACRENRFLWVTLVTFTLAFIGWHVVLHAVAQSWVVTAGEILGGDPLNTPPQTVDGHTISAFDGSYVGHLAWLVPLPVWIALAIVVAKFDRLDLRSRRFALLAAAFVAATLLVAEGLVLNYFNLRYATYVIPFIFVTAWLATTVVAGRSHRSLSVLAVVLLTFSTATPPHVEHAVRRTVLERPISHAVSDGHELRRATDGRTLATTFRSRSDLNYLSYLFRRPFSHFEVVREPSEVPADAVVVTGEVGAFPGRVIYKIDGFQVIDPSASS